MNEKKDFNMACPVRIRNYPKIVMAHGGGGTLMQQLIADIFIATFGEQSSGGLHDSSVFDCASKKCAFTTDSYVVHPLFFPGGDIGCMSVYGTVNDLCMSGARPQYLSAGFILEEGLDLEVLWRVVQSMKAAADHCGVRVITGDTKVVDRGKGDGVFINTSGLGFIEHDLHIHPSRVQDGDAVLVTGDVGRHGITIMAQRQGLSFESTIESDVGPLQFIVQALLSENINIHCLRDLTRGGMASALNEIAQSAPCAIHIDERAVGVDVAVQGACEILGFDPLYVACEGRAVVFVPQAQAQQALEIMRAQEHGKEAQMIGYVSKANKGLVTVKSCIGVERVLDMITGEQLPRIC